MANVVSLDRLYCNRCQIEKPSTDFSEYAQRQAHAHDPLAMCQQCVDLTFKSCIARDEVPAYVKQDMERRLAPQRLRNQELMMNAPSRMGRTLSSSELIMHLQRLIPGFKTSPGGILGDISFYRALGDTIDSLGWVTKGIVPEYSIVHVDARGLPKSEQRGWRTVLIRLIKHGVITEAQCDREFGLPSQGEVSCLWREALWDHRQDRTFS